MALKLGSALEKGIIWNMDGKVVSAFLSLRMHAAIMKCSEVKIKNLESVALNAHV